MTKENQKRAEITEVFPEGKTLVKGLANELLPPRESRTSHTLHISQYRDAGLVTSLTYGGKDLAEERYKTPIEVVRAFREAFERLERQLTSPVPSSPSGRADRSAKPEPGGAS